MPLIAINGPVPDPTLSQVLQPHQYQAIYGAINRARSDACCYSCAVEWMVCLFTPVWCIFCCHTCIEDSFFTSQAQS